MSPVAHERIHGRMTAKRVLAQTRYRMTRIDKMRYDKGSVEQGAAGAEEGFFLIGNSLREFNVHCRCFALWKECGDESARYVCSAAKPQS